MTKEQTSIELGKCWRSSKQSIKTHIIPRLSKMPAFLEGLKTGRPGTGVFEVHHLVDNGVVHGRGLGQQRRNNRNRNGHWIRRPESWHHGNHCVGDPSYQKAGADQHGHLRNRMQRCHTSVLHTVCLNDSSFARKNENKRHSNFISNPRCTKPNCWKLYHCPC